MLPLFLCPQNGRSGTTSAGSSVFPVPRAGGFPVMRQGCVLPLALPSSPKNVLPGLPSVPRLPCATWKAPGRSEEHISGALAIHGCGPCHAAHIQGSRGAAGHLPGSLLLKASSKSSVMRFFVFTSWHAPLTPRTNPIIRTTRKAGGLLWPYKGLLPAAPKDAGFHVVQAQCPCRLDYPLKGS